MAASAQVELPIFDFPVVSNDDAPKEPKPGDQWTETVWKEAPPPGSWNRGEELGTAEIQAIGPPGSPRFKATVRLLDDPDNPIEVEGAVPGGDRWIGKGKAKAKGRGREKDDVPIEFKNPKRWG